MTLSKIRQTTGIVLILLVLVVTQQRSDYDMTDPIEKVRAYTRWQEFDYGTWMGSALTLKFSVGSLNIPNYLDGEEQRKLVFNHLELLTELNQLNNEIAAIYANPNIQDPDLVAARLMQEQAGLKNQIKLQQPLVEAVIQNQISAVVGDFGLGLGNQPMPPLLYHSTSLPMALIVSPREEIKQIADISVMPELTLAEITRLEESVASGLNVSALVDEVGGVGVYPTMVAQTTNLNWLVETIAHEWIHNYLTLRPLGILYFSTPEMRTINETTANIAGAEIGAAVIERFYPEFMPPPQESTTAAVPGPPPTQPAEPVFDFRAEMHETRVTADALLAEGKIEEAEAYMEDRRLVFWENGYQIRKLNQAYFAFHGAYADEPGGAAGEDPVGAAVRSLRAQSPNLESFLNEISFVVSFEGLERLIQTD
ncbi:MAG: hypothetical protein ACYC3H_11985 [Bellilinea sp.]